MGDTLITVIAIFLAAVLMFVFPLMAVSERTDDISQLAIQTSTTEFVDNIRATGKLTLDDYEKFVQTVSTTGNSYEIDLELKILDENPGVKTAQVNIEKIGENVYYNKYTSQILEELTDENNKSNKIKLKEGDIVSVSIKNTNKTIAQLLRNFFYSISGNDSYQITAKHAGIVTINGSN